MTSSFSDKPILNSPYSYPGRHWELEKGGQLKHRLLEHCLKAAEISPKIIERRERPLDEQIDLFSGFNSLPCADANTEFYQHDAHWANRMILAKSSTYKLVPQGRVPGHKVGKPWRFRKDAIQAWLREGLKK